MLYPPGDCNYPKLVYSAVVLMLDHPLCGGVRENYVSVTRSLKPTVGKEGMASYVAMHDSRVYEIFTLDLFLSCEVLKT